MITLGRREEVRHRLVVCGDNQLAYRLAVSLAEQGSNRVTVLLKSRKLEQGRRIAAIDGVTVVESPTLDADGLRAAGIEQADALALVDRADVENIHTALRAHELNPNLRLVIRFANMSLGFRIRELFPGCVVLSDAATAGALFVDAALGQVSTSHAELPGRDRQGVYVARRSSVAPEDILIGLADTSAPVGHRRLPVDDESADLVLAKVTGPVPAEVNPTSTTSGELGSGPLRHLRAALARLRRRGPEHRRSLALGWARTRAVLSPKLALASLGLLGLLVLGTAALTALGEGWGNAAYVVVLDAAGAAQPDTSLSAVKKILQAVITVTGITFIPVSTAYTLVTASDPLASPHRVRRILKRGHHSRSRRPCTVLRLRPQVRVDPQRDLGTGMPHGPLHCDDVATGRDQSTGVMMSEIVQPEIRELRLGAPVLPPLGHHVLIGRPPTPTGEQPWIRLGPRDMLADELGQRLRHVDRALGTVLGGAYPVGNRLTSNVNLPTQEVDIIQL